jgi:hypothetical protein
MRSRSADPDATRGSPEERSNGRSDRWEEQSGLTAHDQRSLDAIRRQLDAEFGGQEQEPARREPRPRREPRGWRRDRSNRLAWEWVRAAVGGFVVGSAVALCLAVLVTALYLKNADHGGSVPDPRSARPEVAQQQSPASSPSSPPARAPALTPTARPEQRAAARAVPPTQSAPTAPSSGFPRAPSDGTTGPADASLGEKLPPRSSVRVTPILPARPPRSSWEITRQPSDRSPRPGESP